MQLDRRFRNYWVPAEAPRWNLTVVRVDQTAVEVTDVY